MEDYSLAAYNPDQSLVFKDVAGDTYECPSDMLEMIAEALKKVPVDKNGQSDMNEVSLEMYDNQFYVDGEARKKKIKHIAFVVIYE